MKVVTSLSDMALQGPSVVSIGKFDAVHLGHQAILGRVRERARAMGVRPVVMTFSPHPVRFLAPRHAPPLILTLDQKIRQIAQAGIEVLFVAEFNRAFSQLNPEEFIQRYLLDGFQARAVCVGSNFNFGYRQSGTVETLRSWKREMQIVEVPPAEIRGTTVSSSRIRQLVASGDVSQAGRLLGRALEIEGKIMPGSGQGKSETHSTLNLRPQNELLPALGVYVTQAALDGGPWVEAMTTFRSDDLLIETRFLDGPLPYGPRSVRLQFLHRLHGEIPGGTPQALRQQIGIDIEGCRRFFRRMKMFDHAVVS